ncbi:helicase-associated domain-containing protein, partial [Singulisphaera rosea]
VALGLKPPDILARLKRHASTGVPANVQREVEEWSQWTREVTASTLTVFRCPDSTTADRLMSALKRHAERLNDTIVATQETITGTLRTKLQDQGLLVVKGEGVKETKKSATTKKKSRRRY